MRLADQEKLLAAQSASDFLLHLAQSQFQQSPLPYTKIAKTCGFKSRAHCREVFIGKRPLTFRTFEQVCYGLGIEGRWRRLLEAFVQFEAEDELLRKEKNRLFLEAMKNDIRNEGLWNQAVLLDESVRKVFVKLPRHGPGVTTYQLAKKINLDRPTLRTILSRLVGIGLASEIVQGQGKRYLAIHKHWVTTGAETDDHFVDVMSSDYKWCEKTLQRAGDSEEHLFLSSSVTISPGKARELKAKLRDVCVKFIDEAEKDSGDQLVKLVVGFGPDVCRGR